LERIRQWHEKNRSWPRKSGPAGFRIKGRGLGLSSGETKRLGIARALVIEPEVFCLDVPTANLDPKNAEIIE
jgi:ABC-type transport system involved in cytochrome bd biosynthesis fused ATPase/permease subunit